jgi:hypothetical protein
MPVVKRPTQQVRSQDSTERPHATAIGDWRETETERERERLLEEMIIHLSFFLVIMREDE